MSRALVAAERRLRATRLGRELDRRLDLGYLVERLVDERALLDRHLAGPAPDGPLLSIVLPLHGIPLHYVRTLLASVAAQTHRRWEVCACDDADPHRDVAAHLAALAARQPSRFRLAHHDDRRGISAATRSAVALARGEALVFVDADDRLHPRALEAIARKLADGDDVDLVYTDNDLLTDWGHRIRPTRKPAWSPELLIAVNYIGHLVAIRRACLERCPEALSDETSGAQDWALCLAAGRAARRVAHVPLVLYHWRRRPGSTALDARSKPWVLSAGRRVIAAHVASLGADLELNPAPSYPLRLRVRPGAEPPLHVVLVDGDDGAPAASVGADALHTVRAYPRSFRSTRARASDPATVDDALAETRDGEVALLLRPAAATLEGDVAALVAFARVPGVACAWPFRRRGLRRAYTVDDAGDRLVALQGPPRSSFSSITGNVLAGGLHGLCIRGDLARALLPAAAARRGHFASLPDAYGAALALAALEAGYRNVCVADARTDEPLAPLTARGLPRVDPYL